MSCVYCIYDLRIWPMRKRDDFQGLSAEKSTYRSPSNNLRWCLINTGRLIQHSPRLSGQAMASMKLLNGDSSPSEHALPERWNMVVARTTDLVRVNDGIYLFMTRWSGLNLDWKMMKPGVDGRYGTLMWTKGVFLGHNISARILR